MRGRVIGASDRCSCVSACPSKFGVYVKVQRSTDSSSQGRRAVVLYLGRFTAFCLAALTDFFRRFSSFASLSVVPPSNCVPSKGNSTGWGVKAW